MNPKGTPENDYGSGGTPENVRALVVCLIANQRLEVKMVLIDTDIQFIIVILSKVGNSLDTRIFTTLTTVLTVTF